jgi:hypothetical protein
LPANKAAGGRGDEGMAGTTVPSGRAVVSVVAIGAATRYGRIVVAIAVVATSWSEPLTRRPAHS